MMQIQVNTDKNISSGAGLTDLVESTMKSTLARFSDQITRIEVHLSDENSSAKSGIPDKRCQLEVRLAGRQPISVHDTELTVDQAVHGAADKMLHLIETELGKLSNRKSKVEE